MDDKKIQSNKASDFPEDRPEVKQHEPLDSGIHYHIDEFERMSRIYNEQDLREGWDNLDMMTALERRFRKEFSVAEEKMEEKARTNKANAHWRFLEDLGVIDNPVEAKAFEYWERDRIKMKEKYLVHPIDDLYHEPVSAVLFFGKLGVTLGLLAGLARGFHVWRNLDMEFTKLNGIRRKDVLLGEGATGVIRGLICSFGASGGFLLGEQFNLLGRSCINWDHYQRPHRNWSTIATSGAMAGMGTGALFAVQFHYIFSNLFCAFLTFGPAAVGGLVGTGIGLGWYQPFADKRGDRDYDTLPNDPKPWYKKEMTMYPTTGWFTALRGTPRLGRYS